ncbi:hypothetical protein [Kribbella sp. NPDC048915]|uniref:hypothetical protein n=1 Tax=Kribbella sp. NPDC048915 TaxID=3155148 RepID=UPI0033E24191
MPDTDDDQSVELVPDQREQGDDDTEAARERRAAQARAEAGKHPLHDLAAEDAERRDEEDLAVRREEDDAVRAERLEERAAADQRQLEEQRNRDELLDEEAARAFQLAYSDEAARDRYRGYAANDVQRGLDDRAHGRHLLDEAAVDRDEPGAAELTAEGRRYQNAATIEERKTQADDGRADAYDASAREHRREAQPSASEAVRRPPEEAPEAQLPQARRHLRSRVRTKQGKIRKPNRSSEPDLDL